MDRSVPESLEQIRPFEIAGDVEDENDDENDANELEGNGEAPFCDEDQVMNADARVGCPSNSTSRLAQARNLLCLSRFCYHISELTWNFGWSIWLAALSGYTSLFWVSAYQLAGRVLILLVVPSLSAKIDGSSKFSNSTRPKNYRSRLVTTWILGQHACVMITILLVYGTLRIQRRIQELKQEQEEFESMLHLSRIGLVLICLCGGFADVLHWVMEVAINRDWIVVMAEEAEQLEAAKRNHNGASIDQAESDAVSSPSSSDSWLQGTNVVLRQIYLGCEIAIPFVTGSLLTLEGDSSLWIVFGLKGISMVVVSCSMHKLCQWVPALQGHPRNSKNHVPEPSSSLEGGSAHENQIDNDHGDEDPPWMHIDQGSSWYSRFCCYCSDCKTYLDQKGLVGAGIALAFLYGNIMTFGGTMVAYLAEIGSGSVASIGLWKGLSNVSAVFGTVAFSRSKQTLETKGLWSLMVMVICLSVSVTGIWMERAMNNSPESSSNSDSGSDAIDNNVSDDNDNTALPLGSILVIAGTIASRMGLWGYDLCVTQLYQNHVEDSLRGKVGGTQTILNNAFEFIPFLLTMVVSGVQDFWIVMVVGYASVVMALLSYLVGTYRFSKAGRYGRVDEVEVSGIAEESIIVQ